MANRWWCGPTTWRQGNPDSQPRLGASGNTVKTIIRVRVTGAARHRRRGDRVNTRVAAPAHGSLWHEADVPARSNDVCSWGKTGRHMLVESLRAVFGTTHRTCLSPRSEERRV